MITFKRNNAGRQTSKINSGNTLNSDKGNNLTSFRDKFSFHRSGNGGPLSLTSNGDGNKYSTTLKLDRRAGGQNVKNTEVKFHPLTRRNQASIVTFTGHS